jgi:hypothetical protein
VNVLGVEVEVRRSTVLADALVEARARRASDAVVRVGRRPCRGCSRTARTGEAVASESDWPRAPGPFSSPGFATWATVAVVVAAVAAVGIAAVGAGGAG